MPPSAVELEAIGDHHIALVRQAGAQVTPQPDLGLTLVSAPSRGPGLNFATHIRWQSQEFEQRLAQLERLMRDAGEWPVVAVDEGLSQPPDLALRLERAGWLRISGERTMVTRHPAVVPHLDPGLRVEAVTAANALDCARLETVSFGLPPDGTGERAERIARLVGEGSVRAFLLRLVREPIAGARLTIGPGVASLSAVSVAARHRRRGYGAMITAIATRAGLATGHKLVWLSVDESNIAAVKTYASLGFEPSFSWSRWAAPTQE